MPVYLYSLTTTALSMYRRHPVSQNTMNYMLVAVSYALHKPWPRRWNAAIANEQLVHALVFMAETTPKAIEHSMIAKVGLCWKGAECEREIE
jgi:hypothetical protein